jgi:hypothetical protein
MTDTRKVTFEELNGVYEGITAIVRCDCEFASESVGGQPAGIEGIKGFVQHHLKLTGEEAEKAVARILSDEVGEKNKTPDDKELEEVDTYGVNVIRRTAIGPYLGNWMIKANMKLAASRLGIFVNFRGSKGDFAEAGRVQAWGCSLLDQEHPDLIFLVDENGKPAQTEFKEFMGRVSGPSGSVSIVHHSEVVPPGTRFGFEYRFIMKDVREDDIVRMLALAMNVGIGSVKALERGKYHIKTAEIVSNRYTGRDKKVKEEKPEKKVKDAA